MRAMTRPTNALDVAFQVGDDVAGHFQVSDRHFTANGVEMTITDPADGQRYTLELRPLRTSRGVQNGKG